MTTTTFSGDESIRTGDVLVYKKDSGGFIGAEVINTVWVTVDGVERKYFVLQFGEVAGNAFVKKGQFVSFLTREDVQSHGYKFKWKPDTGFRKGEFLLDQDLHTYYVQDDGIVWKLSNKNFGAVHGSPEYWGRGGKIFKVLKTADQRPFGDEVKTTGEESN